MLSSKEPTSFFWQLFTVRGVIKAYRNLHTLRRWDNVMAWLYAITSNMCKNQIRAQTRRPDREFTRDQTSEILNRHSSDFHRDDRMFSLLHEALDSLPEVHRQIIPLM